MIETLKRVLARWRTEDHEGMETPLGETWIFSLKYDDLPVGSLTLTGGVWEFAYSPEFQKQGEVQPIIDFPDLDRTYRSQSLWPFFMARIPSLSQPKVQATIESEGLDKSNAAQLLRRFGERTISNPFRLEPSRQKVAAG
jgi:HipA-like protein